MHTSLPCVGTERITQSGKERQCRLRIKVRRGAKQPPMLPNVREAVQEARQERTLTDRVSARQPHTTSARRQLRLRKHPGRPPGHQHVHAPAARAGPDA